MNTYAIYQKVSKWPFGHWIFSRAVCRFAPYFSSIKPFILEMRPGYCRVRMKERPSVHNHIGTIHAIAVCNLCEIAMGMTAEASVVPPLRWIPRGMTVEYLKKTKGILTAECIISPEEISPGNMDFPIEVKDEAGDVVMTAGINVYISEKPKS